MEPATVARSTRGDVRHRGPIRHEHLVAAELEDLGRKRDALRVSEALVPINDDVHWETLLSLFEKFKSYHSR
jgi:hypothetical protein